MTEVWFIHGNHDTDSDAVTGKPVAWGGSEGRNEATGFGISVITREAAKKYGIDIKKAKVAIQGFGNVGRFTVKNIQRQGAKIVALGEWAPKVGTYALYNEDGLILKNY